LKNSPGLLGAEELWASTCVYGSYIDQRITTVCCGLSATDIDDGGGLVAEAHGGPASPSRLFICVCLSPPNPACSDDRRIGVRLPVGVGGFCRCVETNRPWVGLRQEAMSPGVSQRGVHVCTRFLLLSKDHKEWIHTSACL